MKKLPLFLVLIILIAGCNLIVKKGEQQADILGTEGLVLTLPTLPTELYIGQGLEIPVTIENAGTYSVKNAMLSISGYNTEYVAFRETKFEGINLEGKTNFLPGEKTMKIFTLSSIILPTEKEKKEVFEVIACYQYETDAIPVVCINPQSQLGAQVVKGSCDFVDAKISPSQGAPIAVTKVETYYYTDKEEAEFRIYVKDVSGKGILLAKEAYAKRCLSNQPLTKEDQNKINIEAYLGTENMKCYSVTTNEPAESFIMIDNAPSIRCRAKINYNEPAYTSPLSIYLTYGYTSGKVSLPITLKNPLYT